MAGVEGDGAGLVPHLIAASGAVPATVGRLRRRVLAFAAANGAGEPLLEDIARAVSEAVANAVVHAYEPGEAGLVHLVADVEEDTLEVVVADDGHGFRAGESGGLGVGLSLIAASCDEFGIREREPRGTEVWMRFVLPR